MENQNIFTTFSYFPYNNNSIIATVIWVYYLHRTISLPVNLYWNLSEFVRAEHGVAGSQNSKKIRDCTDQTHVYIKLHL